VFSDAIWKSDNFILYKNSFVGYKLIVLQLQVKFKNVSAKFFPKCTYLVDLSGMISSSGVNRWGPPL